jgi:hypothetical protein
MIVGNALEAWLGDPARQRRTQTAIDDFARAWRAGPVHQGFERALAALPEHSAEAIAEAMRLHFADTAWLDAFTGALADALAADPFFEPPFPPLNSDVHSGLLVFEDPRVSIAIGVTAAARLAAKKHGPRGATSIGFTGQLTVLKFVKAGGARLSIWEAPRITDGFSAGTAGHCTRSAECRPADGDTLVIDGRHQAFVIEEARASLLVLQAGIALDQAPLSVEYDSATHGFIGCSATGDGSSRIQLITSLLRKLDAADAFEAMRPFLDHRDFFVRWHVLREMFGIDAAAALPLLRRMAEADPHPDPRRTAQSVLARYEKAA